MSNKTYSFVEQLEKGEAAEKVLDDYFSKWYVIVPVTMEMQRMGIDRVFERKIVDLDDPLVRQHSMKVEYKADSRTQDTGNVFIETYSVVEQGKEGWALTSKADILVYFAEPDTLYIVQPSKIREMVKGWKRVYGEKVVRNKRYHTTGIPVPEKVFATICERVRRLN